MGGFFRRMRPTRRRFLLLGGMALVAWPLGGCSRENRRSALAARFEEHFHYLDLRREDLLRFFEDLEDATGSLPGPKAGDLPFLRFLASTDFFLNGADESRPVRYVALRDPYVNPCFNPFLERL